MDFSDRLAATMKHRGLNQPRLADRLGVSQAAISLLCAGRGTGERSAERLAPVLDVPLEWLRDGDMASCPDWARTIYQLERDLAAAEREVIQAVSPEISSQAQDSAARLRRKFDDLLGRRKKGGMRNRLTIEPGAVGLRARVLQLERCLSEVQAERDALLVQLASLTRRMEAGDKLQATGQLTESRAAAPRTRYRIGQFQKPPVAVPVHADDQ